MDELCAEYAQPVLDQARTYSGLNDAIEDEVRYILNTLSKNIAGPVTVESVTGFANGRTGRMNRPDGPRLQIIHGYPRELLVLAAACRTAERL